MAQSKTVKLDGRWILFDPELMPEPNSEYFSCVKQEQKGQVTGRASGRGDTCFYRAENNTWALRHYLRGGLVAKLLKDKYFGMQLKNSRAWKEWHLLNQMHEKGLPVPKPVAAGVTKKGLFYRADLISEYIEATRPLADVLAFESIDEKLWRKIGQCIRQFHQYSVYHSDLNAKNILIDADEKVYLIDFDQCCFRKGESWKISNLNRLRRSLDKFKSKDDGFQFVEENWQHLLNAYQAKK